MIRHMWTEKDVSEVATVQVCAGGGGVPLGIVQVGVGGLAEIDCC